jgi:hypothetical protein
MHTGFFMLYAMLIGSCLSAPHFDSKFTRPSDSHRQSVEGLKTCAFIESWSLYDSDQRHIWNRLYRALYARKESNGREYGYDELDPLLWHGTKYLISDPINRQVTGLLDEFLASHSERVISDPLKKAIFQRDMWSIFDWTTQSDLGSPQSRTALQLRLARIIRRVALSEKQIRSLPDNYQDAVLSKKFAGEYDAGRPEVPFLPPDLLQPNREWVPLSAIGGEPVAPSHTEAFSGRSVFLAFIRLPAGREATVAYLKQISEFSKPWIQDRQDFNRVLPNPDLMQFPAGTQLALVRRMVLIDEKSHLVPTNLIESVQFRVHRAIPRAIEGGLNTNRNEARTALDTYEFKLSRAKLFAGDTGGLRSVLRDEKEFPLFQSHGIDLFEELKGPDQLERDLRPVLSSCASCHFRPGIHGMLSRTVQHEVTPSWDPKHEAITVNGWKRKQYSWGLLQGLWQQEQSGR